LLSGTFSLGEVFSMRSVSFRIVCRELKKKGTLEIEKHRSYIPQGPKLRITLLARANSSLANTALLPRMSCFSSPQVSKGILLHT
jgi:hypothetical protein